MAKKPFTDPEKSSWTVCANKKSRKPTSLRSSTAICYGPTPSTRSHSAMRSIPVFQQAQHPILATHVPLLTWTFTVKYDLYHTKHCDTGRHRTDTLTEDSIHFEGSPQRPDTMAKSRARERTTRQPLLAWLFSKHYKAWLLLGYFTASNPPSQGSSISCTSRTRCTTKTCYSARHEGELQSG